MHEDADFWTAIHADPEDDRPRLAYADWLDAEGEGERAELIRVQCLLARLPDAHPRRETLQRREEQIRETSGQAWLGPFESATERFEVVWRRGFPEGLRLRAGLRLTEADLDRLAPLPNIRQFDLSDSPASWDNLAGLSRLADLESLVLGGGTLKAMSIEQLRHVPTIRDLVLQRSNLNESVIEALGQLVNLESIDLGTTPTAAAWLGHLVGLTQLRRLALGRTRSSDASFVHLSRLAALEDLRLFETATTGLGLSDLATLPRLRLIDLGGTEMTDDHLPELAALEHLEIVDLYDTGVTDKHLSVLVQLPKLKQLDLTYSYISELGIEFLRRERPDVELWVSSAVDGT